MKCQIPEISWHNRDPVLSVDIQATDMPRVFRLASGGTDSHVLVSDTLKIIVEYVHKSILFLDMVSD